VKALENVPVSQVATGSYHSLALNFSGTQLYSWGKGRDGALGVTDANGNPPECVTTPTRVFFTDGVDPPVINSIAAGESHSMAITVRKEVYTWGYNVMGQTGHKAKVGQTGHNADCVLLPQRLVLTGPKFNVEGEPRDAEVQVHQAAGGAQHAALLVTRHLGRSG
jgi:alpha-tubulin suppressor-like RCC1 family protein